MSHGKVLIVGGGIGGSTLAYALTRLGMRPIVAEARSALEDTGGAFLTLAPNGVNALGDLGLGDVPAAAGGFPVSGLDFFNARGRRIAEVPGEHDEQEYGARGVVLRRARLHDTLAERARAAGAEYIHEAKLIDLRPSALGRRAVFADGRTIDADVVIGADGIWSTVRRLTWPDAPSPRYTGIVDCGGWAQVDLPDTARQQMFFGRRAFFGYVVKGGTAYWFTNVARADEPARDELDHLDRNAWMTRIRALHADDPAPVRTVLDTADAALGAWAVYDMPALDSWHTDHVCLVGDAAHAVSPSSGQGASLAIEDAVVLADHLRDAPDATTAFRAYSRDRKDRAERIVRFGRQIGARKASSAAGSIFRDATLGLFLRMGARATKDQYAYRAPRRAGRIDRMDHA
ncbi:FAD-dependent monooxygenase [Agromyces silvae]|uniref:FAD-dependent monooxygenase n=1 Tax=Agromyces silvae TaxID=3388266 RepID=UPI00280AEE1A|nr:FAD-dependent monooxygenase [Agromyces protaetiae]